MTDLLRTVSPDELPELSEIPEDLRAVVFSPTGPLQSLPYEKLLPRLIATNLAKATKAALDADLAHDADSVALVFNDLTAALNGWYRKLGASGAGNWEQFEELARNSRVLAQAWAEGVLPGGLGTKSAKAHAEDAAAAAESLTVEGLVSEFPALTELGEITGNELIAVEFGGVARRVSLFALAQYFGGVVPIPPAAPTFTTLPSITGAAQIGQTLTGVDGTITGGVVTARAWLRNGMPIGGATGMTYLLVEGDLGANITFRNTATGVGGTTQATSLAAGPVAATFTLPTLGAADAVGDSRTAGAGGWNVSGTAPNESGVLTYGLTAVGAFGLVQPLAGNRFLFKQSFMKAVGATTTRAQQERDSSPSTALTGNLAFADTAVAADAQFAINSDGSDTVLTSSATLVISASEGVNDQTAPGFYNVPALASETLETVSEKADAYTAVGKILLTGNGMPRGDTYWTMQRLTVSGGTCTANHTANFVDGESFGVPGCIGIFSSGRPRYLTKVANSPGPDEYTVDAIGNFVFGGTAPVTAVASFNATKTGSSPINTPDDVKIVKEFYESSAPNFVSAVNAVDYGIPGMQFNRPGVFVADTFGALVDPATGSAQRLLPGTGDDLQGLHTLGYGAYLAGKAIADKLIEIYPDAPDLSTAPTRNNWWAARQSTGTLTYIGTLPPTMRTGFTGAPALTLLSLAGVVIGAVNTSTGEITGTNIVSGSLDFATGSWTITFSSVTNTAALWFEQDIGNGELVLSGGNFGSWTEGTIGRNAVMNALIDMFSATGTGLLVFNGVSSVPTIANSSVPYGFTFANTALTNAINAGTMVASVITGTGPDGFPFWDIDRDGIHSATVDPTLSTGSMANFSARVSPGDQVISGATWRYARNSTLNKIWGHAGGSMTVSMFLANSVPRTHRGVTKNVSSLSERVTNQGTNLFPIDEQIIRDEGGLFAPYCVTPLIDTTDAVFGTTNIFNLVPARAAANIPVADRSGCARLQVRRRNDVL